MVFTRFGKSRLGLLWGALLVAGALATGCTSSVPDQDTTAVQQGLADLESCIARSQNVVQAAMDKGISPDNIAPYNDRIATSQAALGEARQLLADGQVDKAMEVTQTALQECNNIEAAVQQLEGAHMAGMRAQIQVRMGQLEPCIETARQAMQAAKAAGASDDDLVPATGALTSAELAMDEAQTLLAQGDHQRALMVLDEAQADCITARDMANDIGANMASMGQPKDYTVSKGDTLWGISGSNPIYANPFMWPMIYKANREKIQDPDLIFPNQVFSIPRNYSQEERDTAINRAQTRGPWYIGDGPDYFILEGVRR